MNWKLKLLLILILLIPSFIGYPFNMLNGHALFKWADQPNMDGPTDGQFAYLLIAVIAVMGVYGGRVLLLGLTASAIVSLSIVFAGGFISYIRSNIGASGDLSVAPYSPYYIARFVNILTVVPLALAVFIGIPFLQFERSILSSSCGVSRHCKVLLMVVRVVNHIRYEVMPDICCVLAEERFSNYVKTGIQGYFGGASVGDNSSLKGTMKKTLFQNMYIAACGISGALEFIPLWAVEISRLPASRKE